MVYFLYLVHIFPNKRIMKEIQFFLFASECSFNIKGQVCIRFLTSIIFAIYDLTQNILSCFIELTWFWFKSCFYHYIIMLCEGEYPFSFQHDFMLSHLIYCICVYVYVCIFAIYNVKCPVMQNIMLKQFEITSIFNM